MLQNSDHKKAYLRPFQKPETNLVLSDGQTLGSTLSEWDQDLTIGLDERHCRIEYKPEGFLIRDLRSKEGTFVNGTRINEAWLQMGDQIRLGTQEFHFLIGGQEIAQTLKSKNEKWNHQLSRIPQMARTQFPILLLGPSGTGKEVLASYIHSTSSRAEFPYVRVNCCALTETLVESELFGHKKGSFTGALNDRKGAFETARGGTLFLDEIGDLPYSMQSKLLRALENNEIRPVGSDRTIKTDVRVIAATHQNLLENVNQGRFRKDLYFRLNVLSIKLPTLSSRPEDFEDLLYEFAKALKVRFSFAGIQELKKYSWPGQIRELRNLVSRASAVYPFELIDEIKVQSLLDESMGPKVEEYSLVDSIDISQPKELPVLKEIERQMIIRRLQVNSGNQRQTAADLGIPKSTLHDRLKDYSIDPKGFMKDRGLMV